MTVRRHSHAHFDAPPKVVARAVRTVLSQRPPYLRTLEVEQNAIFKTNVRPMWLLLGTDMTIELGPYSGGTIATADVKSQFYILGDAFGYYDRYIHDFFSAVRRTLRTGSPDGGNTEEQVPRDEPTAA